MIRSSNFKNNKTFKFRTYQLVKGLSHESPIFNDSIQDPDPRQLNMIFF